MQIASFSLRSEKSRGIIESKQKQEMDILCEMSFIRNSICSLRV